MIRLNHVTKYFSVNGARNVVLDDVSVTLDSSRRYGVLGANGAGKSTFLKLVAGAEAPNRGAVYRGARLSWPVGFAGGFHPKMTGRENVIFVARAYGADPRKALDFVADFAELGAYLDYRVNSYSTGMQSRLAFGMSMAIDFDCYLVDEVTAVGDARFQARCAKVFAERRRKSGMLMVSHSSATISQFCEAAFILRGGRLTFFEDVEDAVAAHEDYVIAH